MSPRFFPTARQTNWLLTVGFVSVGYALYLRYMIIENVQAGLGCDAGLRTWLCLSRKVGLALEQHSVFGWVALIAAVLNLIRPGMVLFSIALAAAGLGLVMHNGGFAGLAAALLVLSFARPAPAPE